MEFRKIRSRIEVIIGKLKLEPDVLKLFPHQLSGGQQQRVGLARALVANPSILLMDEPFGSLDNLTRSAIQVEFMQLDELRRKTIVMVTHDINEAFMLADRICLIDRGEVIQTGLPKELLMNPINDFVRQFFDGDRLALEFRMVSLNDVWGFLPTATVSQIQEHTDKLHPALSIWSAMEIIRSSSSNHQRFVVSDVEKKTLKCWIFKN